jgi:DNA replication and repair protein RecF
VQLKHLRLRDFRNFTRLEVDFPPGVVVIGGPNGAGKSSLLEAIHYLSYLRSFRASADREVVRFGSPLALVEAQLADDAQRPFDARLVLRSGQRYLRLNGSDVTRFQDFIGRLHSQFFFPGDLSLLTGDPALRREVLDLELLRLKPQLTPVYTQFGSALRQRNRTLKMIYPAPGQKRSDSADLEKTLEVYTQQLTQAGAQVMRERRGLVSVLDTQFSELYSGLAPPGGETVSLRYVCGVDLKQDDRIAQNYRRLLEDAAPKEANLRYTTVGPHRDDLGFILSGSHDLRRYGSQGQMRSAVLAFRLALCGLSQQRLSDDPILLLDDALSEMDDARKQRLLKLCAQRTQVFITSASEREVELIAPLATAVYHVQDASVERVK